MGINSYQLIVDMDSPEEVDRIRNTSTNFGRWDVSRDVSGLYTWVLQ